MLRIAMLLLVCALTAPAQTVSYWFQQWQKKPGAKEVQEYFMLAGTNIFFTYSNNHVVIHATGTNGGGGGTNYIPGMNVAFNFIPPSTYEISAAAPAPPPAPELEGDVLAGPGYGLLTATVTNISLPGSPGQVLTRTATGVAFSNSVPTTVGISITQSVTDFILGSITNVFSNGLLVATGPYVAPSYYLIQPAGLGYLLLTDGGKILLP